MKEKEPKFISICEVVEDGDDINLIFSPDKVPYVDGRAVKKAKVKIEFIESEGSLGNG